MLNHISRRRLRVWTALSGLSSCLLVAAGCGGSAESNSGNSGGYSGGNAGENAGRGGQAGQDMAGGRTNTGGSTVGTAAPGGTASTLPPSTGGASQPSCAEITSAQPIYGDQVVSNLAPAESELYSWTTPEQIQELRAGSQLLTRTERAGLGPGYAFERLKTFVAESGSSDARRVAELLLGERFARARYAWPHPGVTRMGWPGETYGGELVRIVLRPEAWLVVFQGGELSVIDLRNRPVPLAQAANSPERIAGMYFVRDHASGGPSCNTFESGASGYREFIIANESMVAEWSLSTAQIRARIEGDLQRLERLLAFLSTCSETMFRDWNEFASCNWNDSASSRQELLAYAMAQAIPNPNNATEREVLLRTIETLRSDLFEPDPFIVRPEQ